MNEVLTMGGYGMYVWSAYGITLLIFGLNIFLVLREHSKTRHFLKQVITYHNEL